MDIIDICLYANSVPLFLMDRLEELYQHMYSSYAYFLAYGNISKEINTYVASRNGEAISIILFRLDKDEVHVLNEQFFPEPEEIDRFSKYIFNTYSHIGAIVFTATQNKAGKLRFPRLQAKSTQDIVLMLPDTVQTYLSRLGKSTRNYVKRYLSKVKREFPSLSHQTYMKDEAGDQLIRAIIELNRKRMASRSQASYIDEIETERIIKLAKSHGMVSVITINGRICAGTINYRFGENYFLKVIAHDPAYDDYGLGTLCCYLTICECIARQGKEYHFLWGRYEYKFRLMGIQRDLSSLVIYRSWACLLLSGRTALKYFYMDRMYRISDWAQAKARRTDSSRALDRLAFQCLNYIKKMKRHMTRVDMHPSMPNDMPTIVEAAATSNEYDSGIR